MVVVVFEWQAPGDALARRKGGLETPSSTACARAVSSSRCFPPAFACHAAPRDLGEIAARRLMSSLDDVGVLPAGGGVLRPDDRGLAGRARSFRNARQGAHHDR